jgi:hypothetical protein
MIADRRERKERDMGVRRAPAGTLVAECFRASKSIRGGLFLACVFAVMLGTAAGSCWALQRHSLLPGQTEPGSSSGQGPSVPSDHGGAAPGHDGVRPQSAVPSSEGPAVPRGGVPIEGGREPSATAPPTYGMLGETKPIPTAPSGEALPLEAPGIHVDEHKAHGVVLPQISDIPGVSFVETMIHLMRYELDERFLGWRPNDLILGRFTDNVNNYQLGVLEAMRFTTLRLKDSLTRMGEADSYDKDLESALNLFMNKATLFWFPSAESSYSEAVKHLENFQTKLENGQRFFYYRVDNLLSLIRSYNDLLGNVNKTLIIGTHADGSKVSFFEVDDYFYYAKGVAHVLYEIMKVVRVGYKDQLITLDAIDIMDEILHELHRAEEMDPWIILDSDLDGFLANHRANLNAPLSEVAHLFGILSRF